MVEVECIECEEKFEVDIDLEEMKKRHSEVLFVCRSCNQGWIGIQVRGMVIHKRKIVPARIISVCGECPGWHGGYCAFVEPRKDVAREAEARLRNGKTFPDWCPLEDYVEE